MRLKSMVMPLIIIAIMVSAACKREDPKIKELERKLADCKREIEEIRDQNAILKQDLELLKARKAPVEIQEKIKDIVAVELDEKIEKSVTDVIKATEEEKQEQRRRQQENWQRDMAERRQRIEQTQADNIAKELNLDEEQKKQMVAASNEMREKIRKTMEAVWNEKGLDFRAIGDAMQGIKDENNEKMKAFLTEEQFQAYTNRQSSMLNMLGGMFGGGQGGRGRDRRSGERQPPPELLQ